MQKRATQSTLMQGITQDAELQRVLDNPDNFLVSAGFEHVFDEGHEPDGEPLDLVTVKCDGASVTASPLKIKLTDKSLVLKLLVPRNFVSSWISSYKSINSPCEVLTSGEKVYGYISGISCSAASNDSCVVKYTILIDKNT